MESRQAKNSELFWGIALAVAAFAIGSTMGELPPDDLQF